MAENYLINLNEMDNLQLLKKGGGKFYGLVKVAKLIEEINHVSDIKIGIPQTFALSIDAFEKIVFNDRDIVIPDEVLNQAMRALVACGGKVAVRSSADIEDEAGSTHSGEFESVLNVKNKSQMLQALKKVYASTKNVDGAKMGVVIQKMVNHPELAGVAYSKDMNDDEKVVAHYVKHKTADKMIVGCEKGKIVKLPKNIWTSNGLEPLFPENFSDSMEAEVFKKIKQTNDIKDLNDFFDTYALLQLVAVVGKLEKQQGTPVDVEFAIIKDENYNPQMMLLQQRPSVAADGYKREILSNGDKYGYNEKDGKIIEGEVLVWDELWENEENIPYEISNDVVKDKIIIINYAKKRDDFETDREFVLYKRKSYKKSYNAMVNLKHIHAKCLIDKFDILTHMLSGHGGNQVSERGIPFYTQHSKGKDYKNVDGFGFENVKSGDRIRINLENCSYQIVENENGLKILSSEVSVKNLHKLRCDR